MEAGGRLGIAATAVEAVLVALDGNWEQAQRQLKHQVEAAYAASAASAAGHHNPSNWSLVGVAASTAALSRCSSASAEPGLTRAQAIYAYEGEQSAKCRQAGRGSKQHVEHDGC